MGAAVGAMVVTASCQLTPGHYSRGADNYESNGAGGSSGAWRDEVVSLPWAPPRLLGREETLLPEWPAELILPLTEQRRMFEIVANEDRGKPLPMALRRAKVEEPGEWVLDMQDVSVLYLTPDQRGNVLVVRMDLPSEGYSLEYRPPVRLIPSPNQPNLRAEERSVARLSDLKSGELKHRGPAKHAIKEVTRSRFHTPEGEQDGYMVAIEHSIDFGLANISMDMQAGYLPGKGLVYRRMRYTIVRLGLFSETTQRTVAVVE